MLKNYLAIALRQFRQQKGYASLNVVGLAVGLAGAFFILLWMQDELRYDRFHEAAEELFSVRRHVTFSNGETTSPTSITYPAAAAMEASVPEIEHAEMTTYRETIVLGRDGQAFREDGRWAEPAFLEMFTFPLLAGDRTTALDAPDGIVLSERLAGLLFPGEAPSDVLGQTVRVDDRADFRVTGVAAPIPEHSSVQFEWLLPFADYYEDNPWLDHWGNSGSLLYVRLRDGADPATAEEKLAGIVMENFEGATPTRLSLHPATDWRLRDTFENGQQVGGRITYVRIFGVVALLLVLIACVNFMNLTTARSVQRAREIGVRKSLGASRGRLVGQFLSEAVLTAFAALGLALAAVVAGLPAFNEVAGKALTLGSVPAPMWALFVAVAVGAGLLAGSYPALVLSGYQPARVLRGGGSARGGAGLRRALVVAQFAASILLIAGTFVVSGQLRYIQSKHLGLDRGNVVSFALEGEAADRFDAFKQALLDAPGVAAVTAASDSPLNVGSATTDPVWDGKDPESEVLFHVVLSAFDFTETMQMEFAAGRAHAPSVATDSANFVVNEAAVATMGMENPVGESLAMWGRDGVIVGVVQDFHMKSLYDPIEPTVILLEPPEGELDVVLARLEPGRTAEGLAALKATSAAFNPGAPFAYEFLDEQFGEMYEAEQRIATLSNVFAAIAAFVACLGLLGLAAHAAERRRKEIGVRKVLGASVAGVVALLSRDFLALVLAACALALPLAWLGAERWLSAFAFRLDLGPLPFLAAAAGALVLAALTVGVQAYRAATTDPVQALRYE
ncbi:MAG: ABC transporter permease [Bacteroidota bacterium]